MSRPAKIIGWAIICLASLAVVPKAGLAANLPQIWFTPLQAHDEPGGGRAGAEDYLSLFAPDAAWQTVEKHVAAFKIYPEFNRDFSDEQAKIVIAGLAAKGIDLAVEFPVLGPTGWCEPGHPRTQFVTPLMARLKKLGANVRYLAMSGPLVDGHSYTKAFYCHLPIDAVAADAAHTVALVREIFPDIVVGDIEPVGHGNEFPNWRDLDAWFGAWKKASGKPMGFLHTDVSWLLPWQEDLKHFAERAHANNVPFGVILDGDAYDLSDKSFSDDVARHVEDVTALLGPLLDQVNFQSWQVYPRHALPETDPSAMTGEIRDFLRPATTLTTTGSLSAGNLRAHLTDANGAPIANARIIEEGFTPGSDANLMPRTISGFVPAGATRALFGLRIQTECTCPKRAAKALLEGFEYSENGKPAFQWNVASWAKASPGTTAAATVDGVQALGISAGPGQPLLLNGPTFPVTPGAAFDLRFTWEIKPGSDGAGFATLIFIGADGKEFLRTFLPTETTWRKIGEATTNASGEVSIPSASGLSHGAWLRLRYQGDQAHRPLAPLQFVMR
jgi:hypothetical protein